MNLDDRLQEVLERAAKDRELEGIVVAVEDERGLTWTGSTGNLTASTPFFIASVTKLYTAAIVHRLQERGHLSYDDRLVDRVKPSLVDGLHVHRGTDHTGEITLRHLLAHTSGLPDYFLGQRADGPSLEKAIRAGHDVAWTLDDVLGWARDIGPKFRPGQPGKALYSDTNYQLLGRVIEEATGRSYADALHAEVIGPLGLERTWLYGDPGDDRPVPLRDGRAQADLPKAMTSFGPDGGIVSDSSDLMRFMRAFFGGQLFDRRALDQMMTFNRIMYPLESGVGLMRFRVPRIFSPFRRQPALIGHSGLSGAFAFTAPERGVSLAGTVNNIAKPGRSFRLMLRLLDALGRP